MLVANNFLVVHYLLISRCDDRNQEVDHENQQNKGGDEPEDPEKIYIECSVNRWLLLQNILEAGHTKLTDTGPECLQDCLLEKS